MFFEKNATKYLLFKKKVLTLRSVLEAVQVMVSLYPKDSGSSAVGSVHVWGACGRQFESGLPDNSKTGMAKVIPVF